MRRRRFKDDRAASQHDAAAASVVDLVTRKSAPAKRKKPSRRSLDNYRRECAAMRCEDGDWSAAGPGHFVALYEWCHEQVYGVRPVELEGVEWWAAERAAAKMLVDGFGGCIDELVEFIRWSWREEKRREQWRRENSREGGRMGWRAQFQRSSLLTEYRVQKMRQA